MAIGLLVIILPIPLHVKSVNAVNNSTVAAPSTSPLSVANRVLNDQPVDDDHDGIDDSLEQFLAETYAPVIFMEPGEENYPVSVEWHLARASLWYFEDCFSFTSSGIDDELLGGIPSQSSLIGPPWTHPDSFGAAHDENGYGSHCGELPYHQRISTTSQDPDGTYFDPQEGINGEEQEAFYLQDLSGNDQVGSLEPRSWVTYFHVYPTRQLPPLDYTSQGIMIQYWHTFAYNDFPFDDHGGDWDASIQVQLDNNLNLHGVWFSRHLDDSPGTLMDPSQLHMYGGTHTLMTIDGGGHAAFASPQDWCNNPHTYQSLRLGTIVWTDNPDDPSGLRELIGSHCPTVVYSAPVGGTVWKTWTSGLVEQSGDVAYGISPNPGHHGGLVNLGEYNPCTPEVLARTCGYSRQDTFLLAGKFYPLNGQVFIKYSGRWGSPGLIHSGPRGPVFQGYDRDTRVYTSWYNQGGIVPASASSASPWHEPPTTSLSNDGPFYHSNYGTDYVSSQTTFVLAASQNDIAPRFGGSLTFYRLFQIGIGNYQPPDYVRYSAPISLTGPDGYYEMDYYSLDGLNNVESAKIRVFFLDNSAPIIRIFEPTMAEYVHNATITLSYLVDEYPGSSVSRSISFMDSLTVLAGHGLQSGQRINVLTELGLGKHNFTVQGVDNLGNSRSNSVIFTIKATADSIKGDVNQFLASGNLKNVGMAKSFLRVLDAAAVERSNGNCGRAEKLYQAFIKKVQSQSGRGVDQLATTILVEDAQYLITHCP